MPDLRSNGVGESTGLGDRKRLASQNDTAPRTSRLSQAKIESQLPGGEFASPPLSSAPLSAGNRPRPTSSSGGVRAVGGAPPGSTGNTSSSCQSAEGPRSSDRVIAQLQAQLEGSHAARHFDSF